MRILLPLLLLLTSSFSFAQNATKHSIIGTYELELYTLNGDTVYSPFSNKYTINYFRSSLQDQPEKADSAGISLFEKLKKARLHANKNSIRTTMPGEQSETILKYKIENDRLIIDPETYKKYKFLVEYNGSTDVITLRSDPMAARFTRVK